jgi:hypothetical protein
MDYTQMADQVPLAVVETAEFLAKARSLMDDEERGALVDYLARNPMAGDVIVGTGGVRKLRWGLEGRGGAGVIYFYHSEKLPLFVFSIYAKNVQSDLSDTTKHELKRITKSIAENYGRTGR